MTKEEIKQQYSMTDVVERYGFHPDRHGFLHCPFHSADHTASLKIYRDSFYCFGCHTHGDIFGFVQRMENCSFKEAFRILGGDSGPLSDAVITRINKRKREQKQYQKKLDDAMEGTVKASDELLAAKKRLETLEPLSTEWCTLANKIQMMQQEADRNLETYLDVIGERK